MSVIKIHEVFNPLQQSGTRIDKLLAQNFTQIPRESFKKAIKNGDVLVNDKKVKPNYVTNENDEIKVDVIFATDVLETIADPNVEINVVYEHPDFLIIEKPAGISVHPSNNEPMGTVANGLLAKFPEIENVGESKMRPGIVHRIDKYTSGLLIIPTNQISFSFFKSLFKNRQIKKEYIAICWGIFKKKEGVIESFIGRSNSNAMKQTISRTAGKLGNAKHALTKYKVVKVSKDETKSLVLAMPKTGRKHQVRVHLRSIEHPLVGDKMYQLEKNEYENESFERFLLHASSIIFTYSDGKKYEFNSPIPKEFEKDF